MKVYNPGEVTLTVFGTIIDNWNTVAVNQDERDWIVKSGTQGEVTATKKLNEIGGVVITMDQSSVDNAYLSTQRLLSTKGPVTVIDSSGADVAIMSMAVIEGPPDMEKGNESGEHEWKCIGKLDSIIHGGNL